MARDRHVVGCRDPRLDSPGRPEPPGRVGGPVRGIAAGLVDDPQRFHARAEVRFIAVTDMGHRPGLRYRSVRSGVRLDGVAEVFPQLPGSVMAHVRDQQQPGAGDELGGAPAAAWVDQRVVQAVDHEGRHGEGPQRLRARAGQDHGAELAAGARRVVGAVVAPRGEFPDRVCVGVAPGGPRQLLLGRGDIALPIGWLGGEEGLLGGRSGPAVLRFSGRGHHRGERQHPVGVRDRHRLGDHPAHRGADDVRPLDPQRGQQAQAVIGHVPQRVRSHGPRGGNVTAAHRRNERANVDGAVIEPGGQAAVTVVVADDVPAAPREHRAEVVVPPDQLRPEANHEQDGRIIWFSERFIRDGNPVRHFRLRHARSLSAAPGAAHLN